jgi:hypothetical protein
MIITSLRNREHKMLENKLTNKKERTITSNFQLKKKITNKTRIRKKGLLK